MDRRFSDDISVAKAANELLEVQNDRKYCVYPVNVFGNNM